MVEIKLREDITKKDVFTFIALVAGLVLWILFTSFFILK